MSRNYEIHSQHFYCSHITEYGSYQVLWALKKSISPFSYHRRVVSAHITTFSHHRLIWALISLHLQVTDWSECSHHYILTSQIDLSAHITTISYHRLIWVLTSLHSHITYWSERSHHYILISQNILALISQSPFSHHSIWAIISAMSTHSTLMWAT